MKNRCKSSQVRVSFFNKRFFACAVAGLFMCISVFAQTVETTVINIVNARQTSYKKDDETGNDTIILEGSVVLTVTKGDTSSEIKADKITYDRKTEMLFADGNVEIVTKGASAGGETTTANTLLMNTSTLEGIFDGGRVVQTQSDALNLPSGSTLIVFSDIFGKGENNTIAFKNSSLTFCDEEDPHWHIDASRTWLLPGGEFAFFNAFLFVGVLPVLYLPAFYYPKDELIFNPVFGNKYREGYFLQNTIYVYGRKPLSTSTTTTTSTTDSAAAESMKALYNFMKPSTLKEQKREGLILHNLDEDYTGNTTNYLKLMSDWYSNLGYMVGFDGNYLPPQGIINKLSINAYFAQSNVIFKTKDGTYVNFDPASGLSYNDTSNFMGKTSNLRYGGDFEFGISKPFSFSLSLPIYSDPYFSYDFKTREETMDWISYLLESTNMDRTEPTISEISSYSWTMNASYSPSLPTVLKPYLNSLSLSVNSSVNISSLSTTFERNNYSSNSGNNYYDFDNPSGTEEEPVDEYPNDWYKYTPTRKFYYPSQVTPATVSMSLSGTIFQWPIQPKSKTFTVPSYAITMNKPDEIKSESQLEKERLEREEKEKAEAQALAEKENADKQEVVLADEEEDDEEFEELDEDEITLTLPSLDFTPANYSLANGITYTLGYTLSSTINTQISYASAPLKTAEDFDWNNVRAFMYNIKAPMSVSSTFNYGGSFFGISNRFSYDPIWQKHPIISLDEELGGYTQSAADTLVLADYNAEARNLSNSNTVSFKPLSYTNHFADTGINYNTNLRLYRRKFIGDVENPEWEVLKFDKEDEECITVNSLDYILGASEFDNKLKQTLTFTQIMPPLLRQYTGTLNLTFPYVSTSISTGYQETSKDENIAEEERWKKSPLSQSLSVSLFNSNLKFTESYNYLLEEKEHDSLKLSASYKSFSLSYVMQNTYGATLDTNVGWVNDEEKKFLPYTISASFVPATKTYYKWFNRISFAPGVNTSLIADLIKPTNSYFIISPSLSFKINEFFNITFSSTSKNSILYWYFHEGMYDEGGPFPGNMLVDLLNSYRFDREDLRKSSGFKLKSLNMAMSHELHDWKFNMTFKVEPRIVTENNITRYDFKPYVTIGIVWNPMESIKTEIVDEYGEWQLKTN